MAEQKGMIIREENIECRPTALGGVEGGHTGIRCCLVTGDMFGVTIFSHIYLRRFVWLYCDRDVAVGKMSFRGMVRCAMDNGTSSIMKRQTKASHESHMSRLERRFAPAPRRSPRRAPERVFAPVRPGFVAPCMVEAAGGAGGRFGGRGGGPRSPVGSAWVAASACLPGMANPSRTTHLRPGPWRLMAGDLNVRYRASRNRQREYLAEGGASPPRGVRRIAAITAREYADVRDLPLATLSSRLYVKSNIFKFVMT